MSIKILVLGDTHAYTFNELNQVLINKIKEADWVIHTGDYITLKVLKSFRDLKSQKFKGVYGNADPMDIRKSIQSKEVFTIHGKRIGITHPSEGGPEEVTEKVALSKFKEERLDILIYGHTHEAKIKKEKDILIVNPGKAYIEPNSFTPHATYCIIEIDDEISIKVKKI